MPQKKKPAAQEVPVVEAEAVATAAPVTNLCGHINKHFYNTKGRLEDLACDLPHGHKGDHHAAYKKNSPNPIHDRQGRVIEARYDLVDDDAYWGDAAGVDAKDIQAGSARQLTQFQSDLVQGYMRQDPNLTAADAVEMAKRNPAWAAGA